MYKVIIFFIWSYVAKNSYIIKFKPQTLQTKFKQMESKSTPEQVTKAIIRKPAPAFKAMSWWDGKFKEISLE